MAFRWRFSTFEWTKASSRTFSFSCGAWSWMFRRVDAGRRQMPLSGRKRWSPQDRRETREKCRAKQSENWPARSPGPRRSAFRAQTPS